MHARLALGPPHLDLILQLTSTRTHEPHRTTPHRTNPTHTPPVPKMQLPVFTLAATLLAFIATSSATATATDAVAASVDTPVMLARSLRSQVDGKGQSCDVCPHNDHTCQKDCIVPKGPCNSGQRHLWSQILKDRCYHREHHEKAYPVVHCDLCPAFQNPDDCTGRCYH